VDVGTGTLARFKRIKKKMGSEPPPTAVAYRPKLGEDWYYEYLMKDFALKTVLEERDPRTIGELMLLACVIVYAM
jgi:hypothetical protein